MKTKIMKKTMQVGKSLLASAVLASGLFGNVKNVEAQEVAPYGDGQANVMTEQRIEKEDFAYSANVSSGVHTKYLGTYGFSLSENPVVQSDLNVNMPGLTVGTWSNYDPKLGLNELDFYAVKSFDVSRISKHLTLNSDFWTFTFPSIDFPTVYTLGVDIGTKDLPVNFDLHAIQAFGDGSNWGQFFQLRASKNLPLTENKKLNLGLESRVSYNNGYFAEGSGLTAISGATTLNYDLGKGYSISAYGRAQTVVDDFGGQFKGDWAAGISFGKSFSFGGRK